MTFLLKWQYVLSNGNDYYLRNIFGS